MIFLGIIWSALTSSTFKSLNSRKDLEIWLSIIEETEWILSSRKIKDKG